MENTTNSLMTLKLEDYEVVEPTEIQTYHVCPRMWAFAYKDKLRRKGVKVNLSVGIAIHDALEAYYTGGDAGKAYQATMARELDQMYKDANYTPEQEAKLEEQLDLGYDLIHAYIPWAEEQDSEYWEEILYTEQSFLIPINEHQAVAGRIDMIVRDKWGGVWIVDHKTCSQFPSQTELQMDNQFRIYTWASNYLFPDLRPQGVIYNGIRKTNPARARTPVFKRENIFHIGKEIHAIERGVVYDVGRISTERQMDYHPMQPGRHCSWRCSYQMLCKALEESNHDPSVLETLIEQNYEVSERVNWLDEGE